MKELRQFVANFLDLSIEDLKPETNIRDQVDDSLELVELIIALEDRYKFDIPDEDIDKLITIQDIHEYMLNMSTDAKVEQKTEPTIPEPPESGDTYGYGC